MSDYTPTTEDVRRAYQEHCRDYDAVDGLATSPESYEEEFDRWLALVKAEAQVEVLRAVAASKQAKTFGYAVYVGPEPRRLGISATAWLHEHADRIAREAGIETGESNE